MNESPAAPEATGAPPPRKAEPVELVAGDLASEAFAAIVHECTDQWRTNERVLLQHRDVDALHQCRVGLRRLRSAWSLFKPWFKRAPGYVDLAERLREHILPLGAGRDLDVLLKGGLSDHLDADQVARLRHRREAAYDVIVGVLTGSEWEELTGEVDDFVEARPWGLHDDPPAIEVATTALDRRWRVVRNGGADLMALPPEQRHRIRIQAKKVRYGSQFFSDLFPEQDGGVLAPWDFADEVARLQDELGLLNDAAVAGDLLLSVGAEPPPVDEAELVGAAQKTWREVCALQPFWR